MEIKTEFLDEYTNKIDKLLKHSYNQKVIIYVQYVSELRSKQDLTFVLKKIMQ